MAFEYKWSFRLIAWPCIDSFLAAFTTMFFVISTRYESLHERLPVHVSPLATPTEERIVRQRAVYVRLAAIGLKPSGAVAANSCCTMDVSACSAAGQA